MEQALKEALTSLRAIKMMIDSGNDLSFLKAFVESEIARIELMIE